MASKEEAPATYEEYRKVYDKYKEQYGNQVTIFYQVGSFYELYDVVNKNTGVSWCNVKEVIDILGIQLSIKSDQGNSQNNDLLFAGFPDYTLHRWAAKLTQLGWTVVVVEQKKDSRGKVETREVSRILSPGTHNECATAAETNYVASIWLQESATKTNVPTYGLSALDLTTGSSASYEGYARGKHNVWSADEGLHFFQIYPPREVIIHWRGETQPSDGTIRRIFGLGKQPLHFRQALPSQQGGFEIPLVREEFLKKHFQPKTLLPIREYLHIAKTPLSERSICCLLRFIEDHFSNTYQLQEHVPWNPSSILQCGNNALSQLNFVGTDDNTSVIGMFSKCMTPMGKRAVRRRLLTPLTKKADIDVRLAQVEGFLEEPKTFIEQCLNLMFDMPRLHRKIMNFSVSGGDVLALYQTYKQIQMLSTRINPLLFKNTLPKPKDIEYVILAWEAAFSKEKAEKANENLSFIRPGIDSKIDELEKKIQTVYDEVAKWLEPLGDLRIEEKEKIPITIKGPKQVIQAISAKLTSIKVLSKDFEGLECKLTKTVGHSIEAPFLERANERILSLRAQLHSVLQIVLPRICIEFYTASGHLWTPFEEFVEEVDCALCFAKVAEQRGFYKPTISDNSKGSNINVKNLRHPLIEGLATRSQYVTHNVCLNSEASGWLLYGMNASGKSSLMKAIGIAVLLAQCGSYVPASEMELAPFERILTRILNVDNLWAGLSSFAVEVSELRDIFLRADSKTLVLGDELCSGTESVSATALVAAGITFLLSKESRFVFATHYHDLFKLPEIQKAKGLSVWHLKVRYDSQEDILVYERTLSPGPGSTLYGIEVAKALGMPFEVLESAMKFRRALQNEKTEEEAKGSTWNKNILVRKCEVCGSALANDLEVHHIKQRVEAKMGRFDNGLGRDDARNLVVVCTACHDSVHANKLEISPLIDTSVGQARSVTSVGSKESKGKWSPEELEIIQRTIQEYPKLSMKMIRFKLSNDYGIVVKKFP